MNGRRLPPTPRQLLITVGAVMLLVSWQTTNYAPGYLYFPAVWSALSLIASAAAMVCAAFPRRLLVAASGSIVVAITLGRSVAIAAQVVVAPLPTNDSQASFVIAAAVWALVGALALATWREIIIPWSIGLHR